MSIKTGVYIIRNTVTGGVYVGSTSHDFRVRFKTHKKRLREQHHDNLYLQRAWNKYGENNFEFLAVELIEGVPDVVVAAEQHWIDFYRNESDVDCYNMRPEASSSKGIKRGADWIKKLIARNEETFAGFLGPDGQEYRDITNLMDFCRLHGLSYGDMHQVTTGERRHHKGWRRIDDPREIIQRRGQLRRFISPNGQIYYTEDFVAFCHEHGLSHSAMVAVAKGERAHHKGWRVENINH